jgi:hypothetical protein
VDGVGEYIKSKIWIRISYNIYVQKSIKYIEFMRGGKKQEDIGDDRYVTIYVSCLVQNGNETGSWRP